MTNSLLNNKPDAVAKLSAEVRPPDHGLAANHPRLPCRGCLASCQNYHHCGGKPWIAFEQPQAVR